jgi:hypothetical protein
MALRAKFTKFEPPISGLTAKLYERIARAVAGTLDEVERVILEDGRADIASAGKFGSRWTQGLQARKQVDGFKGTVTIFHTVPYFNIFEFGGTIKGNPLLWIPLSFSDAVGKSARDYGAPLFRVDRKSGGAPLLLSAVDRQPKYFGKEFVVMPQKFHIRDIIRKVAGNLRTIYNQVFRGTE